MINDRRNTIKNYIAENLTVRIEDLTMLFPDVSVMTIRRDLAALEEEGSVIRIRGGARINSQYLGIAEDVYSRREVSNTEAKAAICAKAVAFLEEKRSIYFDAGTTAMTLAHKVPDRNLTIFTSAPNIAIELAMRTSKTQVTLLGGSLSRNTLSCSGRLSMEYLRAINIDVAFVTPSAFSLTNGFTTGNPYESELKAEVIKKARRVILLLTADKMDHNMPYTFATMADIDVLITDRPLPPEIARAAAENDVTVL